MARYYIYLLKKKHEGMAYLAFHKSPYLPASVGFQSNNTSNIDLHLDCSGMYFRNHSEPNLAYTTTNPLAMLLAALPKGNCVEFIRI